MASPTHTNDHRDYVDPTSIKAQLDDWHADRGGKSFAAAMIPTWSHHNNTEDKVIHNPFKLLALVKGMDWLYFFSGWFAWTVRILTDGGVIEPAADINSAMGKWPGAGRE